MVMFNVPSLPIPVLVTIGTKLYVVAPDEGVCCSECVQYGDSNSDGIINVLDVVTMVNLVLGSGYQDVADMNGDDELNILDVVILANIILA